MLSRASARLLSAGLLLGLLALGAAGAIAQDSVQALQGRRAQLQARQEALTEELRQVRARAAWYLLFVDQMLAMQTLSGERTPEQAEQALATVRQQLYVQGFTGQDWARLVDEHQQAAGRYFAWVDHAVGGTMQWPNGRGPDQWRAMANDQLARASQSYGQKIARGEDTTTELRAAAQVLAWTKGYPDIPPKFDHFGGTAQRVAAAMDQIPGGTGSGAGSPAAGAQPNAAIAQGYALLSQKQYQAALAAFDGALGADPRSADALIGRGAALNLLGQLDGAEQAYEAALPARANMANLRAWIAELAIARNDLNRAEAFLQEELRLFPSSAWAYSFLGTLRLLEGRQPEAQQAMATAMQIDPSVASYRYANGVALGGVGQDRRAALEFSSTLWLNPNLVGAYYGLGLHLARLGDNAQAAQAYQAYLQRDPSSEWAQRTRSELARLGSRPSAPPSAAPGAPPSAAVPLRQPPAPRATPLPQTPAAAVPTALSDDDGL